MGMLPPTLSRTVSMVPGPGPPPSHILVHVPIPFMSLTQVLVHSSLSLQASPSAFFLTHVSVALLQYRPAMQSASAMQGPASAEGTGASTHVPSFAPAATSHLSVL